MSNKTNNYQIAGDTTITTTGNIDDLDVKGYSLLRMNNASLATIRGIRAGYPGQKLTIVSIGAGQVDLAHQNTNSAAANRLINTVSSINTPLAAGVGNATYEYDAETARWRLTNHNQGAPIPFTFNAADFTGRSSMTWTVTSGDVETWQYTLEGTLVFLQWSINTTSVGGTLSNWLQITVPFTAVTKSESDIRINEGGVSFAGIGNFASGNNFLQILKIDLSNFAAATDTTYAFGALRVNIS